MQQLRKMIRHIVVAILGVAFNFCACIFILGDSINWNAVWYGRGDAIPKAAPQEHNRILVSTCAIVLPERWHGETYSDDQTGFTDMSAWPISVLPERYGAGIRLTVSSEEPQDMVDATQCHFLTYSALERVLHRKGGGYEKPPLFSYTVYLEVDASWYTLTYWNHDTAIELPASVREYLETFTLSRNGFEE